MEQSGLPGNWALLSRGTDLGPAASPSWLCPPAGPHGATSCSVGRGRARESQKPKTPASTGRLLIGQWDSHSPQGPQTHHFLLKPLGTSAEDLTKHTWVPPARPPALPLPKDVAAGVLGRGAMATG